MKRVVACVFVVLLFAAACGSEDSVSRTQDASTTSAGPTDTTAVSVTSTTAVPETTEAPVTTAPSGQTTLTTETESATTVPSVAQVGTVAVLVENYLVLVDVATGETSYSKEVSGGGQFADNLSLSPDGTTAYYDISWEDFWYSCEASVGEVDSLVMDGTSEPVPLVFGADWTFALTTDFAAYVTSNRCIPDPEQPDDWVIVYFDTVGLVDIVTLVETDLPLDLAENVELVDITFDMERNLLVLTTDGDLFRVGPEQLTVAEAPSVAVSGIADGYDRWKLLGISDVLGGTILAAFSDTRAKAYAIGEDGSASEIYDADGVTQLKLAGDQFMEIWEGRLFVAGEEVFVPPQDELGGTFVYDVAWVAALG